MEIVTSFTNKKTGIVSKVVWRDIETDAEMNSRKISGARAFCFYGDKLVVVYEADKTEPWNLPGGGTEDGENVEQAVIREVKEETNMKVLFHKCLGYLDVYFPEGTESYTYSYCKVEPYGEFVKDVAGEVTEVRLIEPKDFKNYKELNEIHEHLLKRAIAMHSGV